MPITLPTISKPDQDARNAATARNRILTKPRGALGRIEELMIQLAGCQGRTEPSCQQVHILIFAADHGVAARGVSPFPQAVTAQMCANFASGGAAISVLAHELGATLSVIDAGVATPLPADLPIVHAPVALGTADFVSGPAMSAEQCDAALGLGMAQARAACEAGCELLIAGEMGIGNTTSAACLLSLLSGLPSAATVGAGTGAKGPVLASKLQAVDLALERVGQCDARGALEQVGGFEIAAMAGAMLQAAACRCPVLVDGFIAGSAAAVAVGLNPALSDYLVFAHLGSERGHRALLGLLKAKPLLELELRLGEGSGAALAVPLLRHACALLSGMATFEDAGVSDGK
ncbi:MAG: nicotinate-nucleotide--dimethylbenzimidazole phosphoribosyltransferase [Planctomycetota bacterium]|jgi:nicotinate-nucleotide--dimethylbenzimidazole phosphoribosyltransferase|nr:nicotinate-nucleotide--dimethylbenzimidazole phosphoribosyltransferase [Planctomycetota bacterium]